MNPIELVAQIPTDEKEDRMNSKKLVEMAAAHSGDLKSFAAVANINYNTLYYSTRTDERLDRMPISNFMQVAHALGMTAEELFRELGAY